MKVTKRRELEQYLVRLGFKEVPNRASGHRQFIRDKQKVTLLGHGSNDIDKGIMGAVLKQLERAGISREQVKRELMGV